MSADGPALTLTRVEQEEAIKTWRYLRLAMVALVVGLGASVLYEVSEVHWDCWQTSISAYYYTPVRAYFVAALVAVGVCLYCLKGSTPLEDAALNLAGLLAPIVGLVPTPANPEQALCTSFHPAAAGTPENVANNVTALIVVVGLGLGMVGALTVAGRRREPAPDVVSAVGYALAIVVWVVTMAVFWAARDTFLGNAHYFAAIPMFLLIVFVVVVNAIGWREQRGGRRARNPYTLLAVIMVSALVVCAALGHFAGWDHWTLVLEATLIGAFAVFWSIQTWDLWDQGLRPPDGAAAAPA
jgi:hypothetical protein